jgi:hypothetical protein
MLQHKIPNPNIQVPGKLQSPNSKGGANNLEIGI